MLKSVSKQSSIVQRIVKQQILLHTQQKNVAEGKEDEAAAGDAEAQELLRCISFLNPILKLNLRPPSPTSTTVIRSFSNVEQEDRVIFLLQLLFRGLSASERTVMIVGDGHYLSRFGFALMQRLAEGVPTLLMLLAAESRIRQSGERADQFARFLHSPAIHFFKVEPFTKKEMTQLLAARCQTTPQDLPPPVRCSSSSLRFVCCFSCSFHH